MTARSVYLLVFSFACVLGLRAQTITNLTAKPGISLRGLSVVNDNVVWASGSGGQVARSVDGGNTFQWMTVAGYEKTDFRDIEAFSDSVAVIMGISEPAFILRTTNAGQSWQLVYRNETKGIFLDAMDFRTAEHGVIVGDPIDGRVFLTATRDGGKSWTDVPAAQCPLADSGEAFFASSGTNIRYTAGGYILASGGTSSHFITENSRTKLPLLQGAAATGANSIATNGTDQFIVVGGDFTTKDSAKQNCVHSNDGGRTWLSARIPPAGYRSCVEYLEKQSWITCGLNGVDISSDNGVAWKPLSREGFHVCRKAKQGSAVFFAGGGGRIARLQW